MSSSLAAAGPAANAAMAPTQVANSTLRIVDSSQIRVLGFRGDGPFFTFLVTIPIPFGNRKLAQERTAACSTAKHRKLFRTLLHGPANACRRWFYVAEHHSADARQHGFLAPANARPWVDVPLDAVATKSEDCQRDIGGICARFPTTALNWTDSAFAR